MKDPLIENKLWNLSFRRSSPENMDFGTGTLANPAYFIKINRGLAINIKNEFQNNLEKFSLELGSGWGEVAISQAIANPTTGYVLLEKKMKRINSTIKLIKKLRIENIRIIPANFNFFLRELFLPNQFNEIILNFPDPWPKKKHWKNRTVNANFLDVLYTLLVVNGQFHFASDYGPYARKVISFFRNDPRFSHSIEYSFSRDFLPPSKFEEKRKKLVPRIYYITRTKSSVI